MQEKELQDPKNSLNPQDGQKITMRQVDGTMRKLTPDEESIVQMLRNSGKEPTQQQVNHAINQAEAIGDL